jgi:hypothetical protein
MGLDSALLCITLLESHFRTAVVRLDRFVGAEKKYEIL